MGTLSGASNLMVLWAVPSKGPGHHDVVPSTCAGHAQRGGGSEHLPSAVVTPPFRRARVTLVWKSKSALLQIGGSPHL